MLCSQSAETPGVFQFKPPKQARLIRTEAELLKPVNNRVLYILMAAELK